jgi:hypothetical protein
MIQIPRFHFLPYPSIRTRITDGFPKDFKTAWGDTVGSYFSYELSVSDTSEEPGFDFHISIYDT